MKDLKNIVTNIVAVIVGLGTVIQTALGNVPEGSKWYIWVGAAAVAIISYFTGIDSNGKKIVL